jgi:hypothetical protein
MDLGDVVDMITIETSYQVQPGVSIAPLFEGGRRWVIGG